MLTCGASETDHARERPVTRTSIETTGGASARTGRRRWHIHAIAIAALVVAAFLATPLPAAAAGDSLAVATDVVAARNAEARLASPSEDSGNPDKDAEIGSSDNADAESESEPGGSADAKPESRTDQRAPSGPDTAAAGGSPGPDDSQKKIAIPSVDKTVSAGGAWSKEVTAQSGAALYYRIVATLPEDVADWQTLVYRIVDSPAQGVTVDWKTLVAHVESASGKLKATISPSSKSQGTSSVIELGNIKEVVPSLAFGDVVVVEYVARLPSLAQAGTYRNVAHLEYLVDRSWASTVDVDATAKVPESANVGGGAGGGSGSTFAKTGYFLMRFWWALVLAGLSLIGIGAVLNRTSRENDQEE